MYNAAKEEGIEWQMVELSEICGIKLWTYEQRRKGFANQALFSYSSQRSLKLYEERGDLRPLEAVMYSDDCNCDSCAWAHHFGIRERA